MKLLFYSQLLFLFSLGYPLNFTRYSVLPYLERDLITFSTGQILSVMFTSCSSFV